MPIQGLRQLLDSRSHGSVRGVPGSPEGISIVIGLFSLASEWQFRWHFFLSGLVLCAAVLVFLQRHV